MSETYNVATVTTEVQAKLNEDSFKNAGKKAGKAVSKEIGKEISAKSGSREIASSVAKSVSTGVSEGFTRGIKSQLRNKYPDYAKRHITNVLASKGYTKDMLRARNDAKYAFNLQAEQRTAKLQALKSSLQSKYTARANAIAAFSKLPTPTARGGIGRDYVGNTTDYAKIVADAVSRSSEIRARIADKVNKQSMYESLWSSLDSGKATIFSHKNIINANKFGMALDVVKSKLKTMQPIVDSLKSSFASAKKSISTLIGRIGRIAMYRAIRTALKQISEGFKEGISNAYQYSKALGGAFSQSMDNAATSLLYLKNSLGAALMPVIQSLVPVLQTVIDKFVDFINVVNQLFATLSGQSTYTKALKYQTEYAEATGAAAEATQALLFGFDELNVLSEKSSSGSSSSLDYSKMFEETPIGSAFSAFQMDISDIAFNWKDLTAEDIMAKVITGLNGVTGALIGWQLGGVSGLALGAIIGTGLGLLTSSVTFDANGKLDSSELKTMLYGVVGAIVGGALGVWTGVGAVKGALLGFSVATGLQLLVKGLKTEGDCSYDTDSSVFNLLRPSLVSIFGGLVGAKIGFAIAGVPGAIVGFTIGTVLTFAITSVLTKSDGATFDDMPVDSNTGYWDVDPAQYETYTVEHDADWWVKYYSGKYATGGTPSTGSLFLAGEAGPELVTQIGGRSTVFNEEQLGSSMAIANESVVSAINTLIGVVRSKSNTVTISASDIRKAVNSSSMRVGV